MSLATNGVPIGPRVTQLKTAKSPAITPCWICGAPAATTREHRTKRSDLKSIAGKPNQSSPIFFHTAQRMNRRVGSLDADVLKFSSRICGDCNSSRTQAHDEAWQHLSEYLRSRQPQIKIGERIAIAEIFPSDTQQSMVNVHLYLLKLFGCMVADGKVASMNLKTFGDAILNNRAHPDVYLAFGPGPAGSGLVSMASNLHVYNLTVGGLCAFAEWTHGVDNLRVALLFALSGERPKKLVGTWHPKLGGTHLTMGRFVDRF
jgi:hypothetical protein